WEVSDATEYGGFRKNSWASYKTRNDVLFQPCTPYETKADFFIEVGSNSVGKSPCLLNISAPPRRGYNSHAGFCLEKKKKNTQQTTTKTKKKKPNTTL
ncbi:hypothetical protein, partial [Staphylococcus pseudintermedius]|uniref:hypothetical protein n=1 Tax=Staphylococcus pseudintermedius TaxID=283734 RepID=UPI001C92D41B